MGFRAYFIVALAAFASAEKLKDCSGACVGKGIEMTGCSSINSHCICSSLLFMQTINECVNTECSEAEQEPALTLANTFCDTVSNTKPDLRRRDRRNIGRYTTTTTKKHTTTTTTKKHTTTTKKPTTTTTKKHTTTTTKKPTTTTTKKHTTTTKKPPPTTTKHTTTTKKPTKYPTTTKSSTQTVF